MVYASLHVSLNLECIYFLFVFSRRFVFESRDILRILWHTHTHRDHISGLRSTSSKWKYLHCCGIPQCVWIPTLVSLTVPCIFNRISKFVLYRCFHIITIEPNQKNQTIWTYECCVQLHTLCKHLARMRFTHSMDQNALMNRMFRWWSFVCARHTNSPERSTMQPCNLRRLWVGYNWEMLNNIIEVNRRFGFFFSLFVHFEWDTYAWAQNISNSRQDIKELNTFTHACDFCNIEVNDTGGFRRSIDMSHVSCTFLPLPIIWQ